MSSLFDLLTECGMVDDALLSDNNSVVPVVYIILRLETLRISCMSTLFFDTRLIGLKVPDLTKLVIGSGGQLYENY